MDFFVSNAWQACLDDSIIFSIIDLGYIIKLSILLVIIQYKDRFISIENPTVEIRHS